MNTITAFRISYPRAPKGWKGDGFYYEKETLGTVTASDDASAEDCAQIARDAFPEANQFKVTDESHPCGWLSGSLS